MKHLVLALKGALLLAGCNEAANVSTVAATVATIQQTAIDVCGFVPNAADVTALVVKGDVKAENGLTVGKQIADAICKVANASKSVAALSSDGSVGVVNGVPIHGEFVK